MELLGIDWAGILVPDTPPLEIVLRGTMMYFALLALLRLMPRRATGSIGIMDLLLIVLVADAASNAMTANYNSVVDGIILVATLIGWSYALNRLTYAVPAIDRLVSRREQPVVRNGRLLRRNMRSELVTEEELMRQLRLEGIEDLDEVKMASVEGDGSLSIIKREHRSKGRAGQRSHGWRADRRRSRNVPGASERNLKRVPG